MQLYLELGGDKDHPYFDPEILFTGAGTPYFQSPGLSVTTYPIFSRAQLLPYLRSLGKEFEDYIEDPDVLDGGSETVMAFAQGCYRSYGQKRTMKKDAAKYIRNLIDSGHLSTLHHANYGMKVWGVPRFMSAQLLRSTHIRPSELSQRYCDSIRFTEHPTFQEDPVLHQLFCDRIDRAWQEYNYLAEHLTDDQQAGEIILAAASSRDRRKKVREAARSCLPMETETSFGITYNIEAARHMIDIRATSHADIVIRSFAVRFLLLMQMATPLFFDDYNIVPHDDGSYIAVKEK